MPREARVVEENACYHIITRGNQQQKVFLEEADFKKYLHLLGKYKTKFGFKLYCFCLMPNHVHLLMEIAETGRLQSIMRGINLSYTIFFNNKYEKVGHLWQDRFLSRVIEKDHYFLNCIEYIEHNPLRAKLTQDIETYRWVSCNLRTRYVNLVDELYTF